MLGFLGLGSVAGPAVVQQMAYDNPVPTSPGIYGGYHDASVKASLAVEDRAATLKRLQADLFDVTSDPAKWIADRLAEEMKDWRMGYSSVHYSSIDPDIRNMKSISESAKMRMYFERRVKRQHEVNKTHLTHRIAEYMGMV
jgi:hypothetical protein